MTPTEARDPAPIDQLLDLVARASCPVAFAPPGYQRTTPIRHVVVGHDGSVEADGALALALELADRDDIAVVRVVRPGPGPGRPGRIDGSPGTPAYDRARARMRALTELYGIRHAVTVGDPAAALARVSRTADLLCVGVGARSERPGGHPRRAAAEPDHADPRGAFGSAGPQGREARRTTALLWNTDDLSSSPPGLAARARCRQVLPRAPLDAPVNPSRFVP